MPATHTDLVIQISTEGPASDAPGAEKSNEGHLVAELGRFLQPGVEIALVFRGYMATTSILWLSGPMADQSLRAGVRLLGVSVLPAGYPESVPSRDESRPGALALHLGPPAISQLS